MLSNTAEDIQDESFSFNIVGNYKSDRGIRIMKLNMINIIITAHERSHKCFNSHSSSWIYDVLLC